MQRSLGSNKRTAGCEKCPRTVDYLLSEEAETQEMFSFILETENL